ncbi:MAG: hypothetical protein GXO70_00255 [Acidobacteria bacterium]|nr:hypothetical protein [Acidobacteriota bacterium]
MAIPTISKQKKVRQTKVEHPFNDLCVTCIHGDTCQNARERKSPVFFCEEFEVQNLRGIRFHTTPPPAPLPSVEPGICVNCARRFDCKVKRPEGGIWHCEMYE